MQEFNNMIDDSVGPASPAQFIFEGDSGFLF